MFYFVTWWRLLQSRQRPTIFAPCCYFFFYWFVRDLIFFNHFIILFFKFLNFNFIYPRGLLFHSLLWHIFGHPHVSARSITRLLEMTGIISLYVVVAHTLFISTGPPSSSGSKVCRPVFSALHTGSAISSGSAGVITQHVAYFILQHLLGSSTLRKPDHHRGLRGIIVGNKNFYHFIMIYPSAVGVLASRSFLPHCRPQVLLQSSLLHKAVCQERGRQFMLWSSLYFSAPTLPQD